MLRSRACAYILTQKHAMIIIHTDVLRTQSIAIAHLELTIETLFQFLKKL